MKSFNIILLLGLFTASTFAQTVTLPPNYGVQSKPDFICGESTVTDYQGNVYNTVKIGNQCWLKENLRSTKYNDGVDIPNVTNGTIWDGLTTPAYCWYNNDYATYGSVYGALYNVYAINEAKLCPVEWHVPNDAEWTQIIVFLGGNSVAGGKLKESGTMRWLSPNTGATNSSGFTAIPGGYRCENDGFFIGNRELAFFWINDGGYYFSNFVRLLYDTTEILHMHGYPNDYGLSVRCVKD